MGGQVDLPKPGRLQRSSQRALISTCPCNTKGKRVVRLAPPLTGGWGITRRSALEPQELQDKSRGAYDTSLPLLFFGEGGKEKGDQVCLVTPSVALWASHSPNCDRAFSENLPNRGVAASPPPLGTTTPTNAKEGDVSFSGFCLLSYFLLVF